MLAVGIPNTYNCNFIQSIENNYTARSEHCTVDVCTLYTDLVLSYTESMIHYLLICSKTENTSHPSLTLTE